MTKLDAAFLTKLCVERAADPTDGAWMLTKTLIYRSVVACETFIIPAGFQTDFASVPRLPFAYLLFGNVGDEAAVVHDFLYSTRMVSRKMADEVLAEAMKVQGVSAWRRGPMWLGVRLFGGSHYSPPNDDGGTLNGSIG